MEVIADQFGNAFEAWGFNKAFMRTWNESLVRTEGSDLERFGVSGG